MSENFISKTAIYQITALALLVTLASCGGSSGGGTAVPPPPPVNTSMLPITADNAQEITVSVLEAVTSSADLVDIADVVGLPVVGSANNAFTKPALGDVITQVTACDTGEMTTTWNDADNNLQVSTGDTFDTQFAMCFFQDSGVTIDGTSTIQDLVVTGDPANQVVPWGLVATFGFIDLIATDAIDTVTINGDIDLEISSDDNVVIDASLGSALLEVDVDGVAESLSDYRMTQLINLNLLLQEITADGIYTSDILQGSVTFETLENFTAFGDDNPSSGQLLISDSSSSVLVTVLDNLNVELGIDLDLDGTIDQTIVVAWADLDIG